MAAYVETPTRNFQANAAIAQFKRVILSSGELVAAGADDRELGTLENAALAADEQVAVRLRTAQGTVKMLAAGAISLGARVYGAASGKINDVENGNPVGIALEAASGDGSVIEVLREAYPVQTVTIEHHTADDTLTAEESGSVHTNLGASGAITFTLPQSVGAGVVFRFNAMAAQELRVDPGAAGAIYISGAKQTDNKYISFDDEAECVVLTSDGNGDWIAGPTNGTISVEA